MLTVCFVPSTTHICELGTKIAMHDYLKADKSAKALIKHKYLQDALDLVVEKQFKKHDIDWYRCPVCHELKKKLKNISGMKRDARKFFVLRP